MSYLSSEPQLKDDIAKVFWSGRSQAIRLPKRYRLSCREVVIRQEGSRLVLEPAAKEVDANGWPVDFFSLFGQLVASFNVGERTRRHERKDPLK
jgi:virulence-associated protein VagC